MQTMKANANNISSLEKSENQTVKVNISESTTENPI